MLIKIVDKHGYILEHINNVIEFGENFYIIEQKNKVGTIRIAPPKGYKVIKCD